MDDEKKYVVGSMFSNKPAAEDLAKRMADKKGKVFFVGEVIEEFHPKTDSKEDD